VAEIVANAPDGRPLSPHQLDAIQIALSGRLACLQGSPGVGKTFSVACIVKAIVKAHGMTSVAIAAPTGKASVRVGQSLLANGVEIGASTIHRLLQVGATNPDGGWGFVHGKRNPLPFKFLIVDESSMIDTDLMASLVNACTREMHVLFVGDSNQLAPVGHGRPFLDLQSIVPTGYLTEIRRNSGRIVQACAEIRDHRRFDCSQKLDLEAGENMVLIPTDDEQSQGRIEGAVDSLVRRFGLDPLNDLQILCGRNTTRQALNKLLQSKLNADGYQVKGNPLRIGDKIVCVKNGKYPDPEDRMVQHFVANGELGRVVDIKPGRMTIALQDPERMILVAHAIQSDDATDNAADDAQDTQRGAVGDWDLGYCLSVHRSQGSQWPFVILLAERSAAMVQSRNWVYTGISRAERATIVIGQRQTLDASMRRDGISDRVTHLVESAGVHSARRVNVDELFGVL
jgi:exodeoxyribonuclease V alpha subunit